MPNLAHLHGSLPLMPARGSSMSDLAGDPHVLSTAEVRCQFPALGRHHRGEVVAYFDGPGGTQVPLRVIEAMSDYLLHHNANTHWAFPTSRETDQAIDSA